MTQDEWIRQMEQLRSQNRRILGLAILVILLFVVVWTYDHVGIHNQIKARQFMLLSDSGETVATLKQEGTGACLDLMGHSRTAAVAVCAADSSGSDVSLSNGNGQIHAVLSAGATLIESQQASFPPGLLISEGNGQKLLDVVLGPDSKIFFGDSSGAKTLIVVIPKNGRPTATFKGNNEVPALANSR